jgi:hypothetical protein
MIPVPLDHDTRPAPAGAEESLSHEYRLQCLIGHPLALNSCVALALAPDRPIV